MAKRPSPPKDTPDTALAAQDLPSADAAPNDAAPNLAAPSAAPPPSMGRGLVLGAAIALGASALGYGAALQFPWPGLVAPAAPSQVETQLAEILALNEALTQRLAALESAPVVDLQPLQRQITAIEGALAALPTPDPNLAQELADIRAKIAQTDPAPAIAAAIEAEIAQVKQTAAEMTQQVQTAAQQAVQMAALSSLRSALDTGAPYTGAAATLNLPPLLAEYAQTGIPSLLMLKNSFPDAARSALEAALRADMGQTWGERVRNFLRSQTGARALAPREGNDPDAILSRMEAALIRADLAAALDESAALSGAAQSAMQDWLAAANLRAQALNALNALPNGGM